MWPRSASRMLVVGVAVLLSGEGWSLRFRTAAPAIGARNLLNLSYTFGADTILRADAGGRCANDARC